MYVSVVHVKSVSTATLFRIQSVQVTNNNSADWNGTRSLFNHLSIAVST